MRAAQAPPDALVLAVDVGGTTIKAEAVDPRGTVVASEIGLPDPGEGAVESVATVGRKVLDRVNASGCPPVARAGLVLPGIVDRQRRTGVFSANLGWRDLAFGEPLEAAWDVPVVVDHDVTIAGWAEWRAGAGRGCDDLFFVALGTGVAASIVAGGRLLRGGLGQAGEFGHVVVRPDGPPCGCGGRGCLETICSASAIARAYIAATGRQVTGSADVLAALAEDPAARRVWHQAIEALADALVSVINLLSPVSIVLGGGLAEAGDELIKPLHDAVTERASLVPVPQIARAKFGARAALVGAALLARSSGAEVA